MATLDKSKATEPTTEPQIVSDQTDLSKVKARVAAASTRRSGLLALTYYWVSTVIDPIRLIAFPKNFYRYVRDWRAYKRLPGAEPLRFRDSQPCLSDRTDLTPFDAHYFYQDAWAIRSVLAFNADKHVDVGSHLPYVAMLSASLPVEFLDIRPIDVDVDGLTSIAGSGLDMPYDTNSVRSLSCLHVAEHVGLGRYGDPLDPLGTKRMCAELQRVLAPGGQLLFSLPTGRTRVAFNGHRIHAPSVIRNYFEELELVEFSAVSDERKFVRNANPDDFEFSDYACGLYRFQKPVQL